MSDTRRIVVRLSGDELRALAHVRARVQELEPAKAVTDAEVLRVCLLERAGTLGWEREVAVECETCGSTPCACVAIGG